MTAYQTSRGFETASGGNTITLQTVDALGVDWRSMVASTTTGSTGFSTGSTGFGSSGATGGFSTGTVTSTGGYTVGSDNLVRNASGVVIGTLQSNGNVVNSAGQVVLQGLSATGAAGAAGGVISGGGLSTGGLSTGGVISGGGVQAGDFTVRSDGSVVSSTTGAVIGRVNQAGEIVSSTGQIIGRVRPAN